MSRGGGARRSHETELKMAFPLKERASVPLENAEIFRVESDLIHCWE